MRKVSIVTIMVLAVQVGMPSALAHSCMTYERESDKEHALALEREDAIFYAKVIKIVPANTEFNGKFDAVYVNVIRSWKGIDEPIVEVEYQGAYDPFEKEKGGVGLEHYFYAVKRDDGKLHVDFCSVDGLFDAGRLTPQLGEPKTFPNKPIGHIQEEQSVWQGIWNWIGSWF